MELSLFMFKQICLVVIAYHFRGGYLKDVFFLSLLSPGTVIILFISLPIYSNLIAQRKREYSGYYSKKRHFGRQYSDCNLYFLIFISQKHRLGLS